MAFTTKKSFTATSNSTTTTFGPIGIELNNQDDLDVYITESGGTRVLQLKQSTASTADANHPQVGDTTGLYWPAVSSGASLKNYTISADNNNIIFNSALPSGAVVSCERRTRDGSSDYTAFSGGSTIRSTSLNTAFDETRFTAQEGRNRSIVNEQDIEDRLKRSGGTMTGDITFASSQTFDAAKLTGTNTPSDNSITSAKIVNGSILDADINSSAAINPTKLGSGTLPSGVLIGSANIPTGTIIADDLDTDSVTTAKIKDGDVTTAKIATTALDGRYYTKTELDPGADAGANTLDARYFTETESDARYFNISSGDTIKDGDAFPDNDTSIATTAAINDRIIDLVDDVGGFVPIASENHFPVANPDVNNPATGGTIVSIKTLSENIVTGSGVTSNNSIAQTTGGTAVTITGLTENTTYAAGFGMLVETTSTLNTYAFHRLTPKATEVTTVAGKATEITTCHTNITNINTVADSTYKGKVETVADSTYKGKVETVAGATYKSKVETVAANVTDVSNFADLYQIAESAPTTDVGSNALAAGDLWFDSSSNKVLKVYDGSAFASTSPSQSVLNDISNVSGQLTYTEDLGSIADALTTESGNNINTVATNINNINSFADQYRVASAAPSSSLDEGDLWYDSTGNVLKYYNGSAWVVTAAAGLAEVSEDTTPALGGHLDCNDKNLTEVGTVSGDNLQIDFGAIA